MNNIIAIAQIVVAALLIILILLQRRDSDMAGFLGGGSGGGGFYQQRRGLERLFFTLTIVLTVVFAGLALTNLLITGPVTTDSTDQNATSTPVSASATTEPITTTP